MENYFLSKNNISIETEYNMLSEVQIETIKASFSVSFYFFFFPESSVVNNFQNKFSLSSLSHHLQPLLTATSGHPAPLTTIV